MKVSGSEWRWVAMWIVVAMVITSVPYLIALAQETPDRIFSGGLLSVEDVNSYLAKMLQGTQGEWLFHLPYTSDPHSGTLFYSFYLLLGRVVALTGVAPVLVYHLARLIFGALLMAVVYRFVSLFSAWRAVRRIAFLFIIFSGGFGWLLILLGQPEWLGSAPIDLYLPEGFTFLILYGFPHIAFARALMLLGLLARWGRAPSSRSIRPAVWAGAFWLGVGLIVPFYVGVIFVILAAAFVAEGVVRRRIDWHEVKLSIIAAVMPALTLLYSALAIARDPVLGVWSDQIVSLSPHPLHYVVGYALVGGLATVGAVHLLRSNTADLNAKIQNARLMAWALVVPLVLYAPFSAQRRLIESWQVPLSILAALALARVVLPAVKRVRLVRWLSRFGRYTRSGIGRWVLSVVLLLTTPTFALLLLDQSLRAAAHQPPMFRDGGEVAALDWLRDQTTYSDAVLAAYASGSYIPARVPARVFVGHGPETVNLDQKLPLVTMFYSAITDDAWRIGFLSEWGIDFVFLGPLERELGGAQLSGKSYLRLEYDVGDYQIYLVVVDAGSRETLDLESYE